MPPGGSAATASLRGTAMYSGAGGTFSFPRMPILVREKAAPKPAAGIQ